MYVYINNHSNTARLGGLKNLRFQQVELAL